MNIYYLLIGIVICLFCSYILNKRDIMSPSVLLFSGYFIACVCCIYNIDKWGVSLHGATCLLIMLGIISFGAGDIFQSLMWLKPPLKQSDMSIMRKISISRNKIILFIVFNVLVLILSIRDMLAVAGGWQSTLGLTVGAYREAYSYTDVHVSTLVVQLIKVSKGSAYAFIYIFINNIVVSKDEGTLKKIIMNIKYILPVLIYLIITLLRGGRINLIMIMVTSLFLIYFFWHRIVGWNKTVSLKFVKWVIIAFVVFAISFYSIRGLVGRQNQSRFVDYLTAYLGGSIQLLDQFLNSWNQINEGLETFPGIMQSFQKLGFGSTVVHKSLEFRSTPTGVYLGNIYTGLRRYYHDFGYLGVVVIQFISGSLFSYFYNKIRRIRVMNSKKVFLTVMYGSYLFCIISHAMEDHFWIDLSLGLVIELIIIYMVFKFIFDYRYISGFKLRRNRWSELEK